VPELTLLQLDPILVPPYSARGITQTLEHISAAASARRTVNGDLVDLSVVELRKYKSTITCTDQRHPALSGVWPGMILEVSCVSELSHADVTDATAERDAVADSEYTEEGFVFYRPKLDMMVISYQTSYDEYGVACNWTIELEEV